MPKRCWTQLRKVHARNRCQNDSEVIFLLVNERAVFCAAAVMAFLTKTTQRIKWILSLVHLVRTVVHDREFF